MSDSKPTLLGRVAIMLAIVIIGIPVAFILTLGTWGMIWIPLIVAAVAAPVFGLHYLTWGRHFSKGRHNSEFW
jgi:hypothetical protein